MDSQDSSAGGGTLPEQALPLAAFTEAACHVVLDSLPDHAIVGLDPAGRISNWSGGAERVFGYRAAEILGRSFSELFLPEARNPDHLQASLHTVQMSGGVGEQWLVRRDGTAFLATSFTSAVRDAAEAVNGFVTVIRDATEQRRAETEREHLRVTLDSIGDAVITTDTNGLITSINPVAVRLTGWSSDEALRQPLGRVFAIVDEYTGREAQNPVERVLREGIIVGLANGTQLISRDGTARPIDDSAAPIRDSRETIVGVVLVFRDVTEKRRTDRALREREAWHRALAELTADYAATTRVNEDGTLVLEAVTGGFTKVTGFTPEELEAQGGWPVLILDEDMPRAQQSLARMVSGEPESSEIRIRTKSGDVRWIRYLGRPLKDDTGRVTLVFSAAQDITEQKRYEQALAERARLAAFGRDVGLALTEADSLPLTLQRCTEAMIAHLHATMARIWTVDEGGAVLQLQASAGLLGIDDPHRQVPVGRDRIGLIAQERRPYLTNDVSGDPLISEQDWATREAIVGFAGYPLVVEDRLVGVMAMFARESLSNATVDAMAAVANGIAVGIERKRAEERIRQQKEWLRVTLSSIGDAVIATDGRGCIEFLNAVAEQLTGWSTGEALGLPLREIFPIVNEQTRQTVEDPVAKVLREGQVVGLANHTVLLARDGIERPIDDSAAPIRDDAGRLLGVVLVFRDVTSRRRAEQTLRLQKSLLECQSEAAPDGILVVSAQGEMISFNRRFIEMWGIPDDVIAIRSDEAALNCVLDKLVAPQEFLARVAHLYNHPHEQSRDEIRLKDGRTFDRYSAPVVSPEGTHYGRVWFFRDITAQRAAEEALYHREQEFKALVENAPDIIARFDRKFRHVYVNPAVERAAGIPSQQFLGRTSRELGMSPSLCDYWESSIQTVFDSGKEQTVEFAFATPEGARHYHGRLVPEFARDRSVATVLGMTRDITDRKRLEAELRDHLERLAEADRRKNEFLAMLAHELRNPLAPLCNALHVLKQSQVDGSIFERIRDLMERQVVNLTRLVDDLLDVSRITTGKIQLRRESIDLALAIRRAVEAARPLIEERRHDVTVSLPSEPIALEADPTRLEQVLTNLLNNAAKYCEPGGRITVACERCDGEAVLRVKDTGIGISSEALPKIFDLFVQAEHTLERAHGGLGIGLTLVRSLVEMHGGSVQAHSDGPGEGSEFIIRLPLWHSESAAGELDVHPLSDPAAPAVRRVLVVDDNVDAAESLALMLELMGHEVRVAYDGLSALEAAGTYAPDVIFLDIGLPGMNGYEVARRLRDELPAAQVTLAALTGWGQEDDRRRSKEAGFDYHLVKPVEPETLIRLLKHGRAADPHGDPPGFRRS